MTAEELWSAFCKKQGMDVNTKYEAWAFGGAPDNLAALVMLGVKTATASAYDLYAIDPDDEPMPQVGDFSVILNGKDEAVCVIQTTKLTVVPFKDVDATQAYKEGEGDRSLTYWRKVHDDFFRKEYSEYNVEFNEDSNVLCEEFECLYSIFEVNGLSEEEARETTEWKYDGDYAVYNYPDWEQCKRLGWTLTNEEKREKEYFSVKKEGVFLGFFHIMDRKDYVELGVGIKPQLCGNHNGNYLMNLALAKIEQLYGTVMVQLTVRPFNQRAITCYENVGFKITEKYYEDSYLVPGEMYIMKKKIG